MRRWAVVLVPLLMAATAGKPFLLTTLDGAPLEVSLAPDERGLVLHFWASWCTACVDEMPVVDRLAARCARSGVRVLFVNAGEAADTARLFATEHDVSGTVVLDPRGAIWRRQAPAGLPANLTWTEHDQRVDVGPRDEAAWQRAFEALGCKDAGEAFRDPAARRH